MSKDTFVQLLTKVLAQGTEIKFGSDGLSLLPEISQIEDIEQLRKILAGIKTVQTISELRKYISHQLIEIFPPLTASGIAGDSKDHRGFLVMNVLIGDGRSLALDCDRMKAILIVIAEQENG